MTKFISLAQAVEEYGRDILADLIEGTRQAIGLENGAGLPTEIPRTHFAIAHKEPPATGITFTLGECGHMVWDYETAWLDLAANTIYVADGPAKWTQIQVEGEIGARVPLPEMRGETRKQEAAIWGLKHLCERRGYPASLSLEVIKRQVNLALRKAPPLFQTEVSRQVIGRLLSRHA